MAAPLGSLSLVANANANLTVQGNIMVRHGPRSHTPRRQPSLTPLCPVLPPPQLCLDGEELVVQTRSLLLQGLKGRVTELRLDSVPQPGCSSFHGVENRTLCGSESVWTTSSSPSRHSCGGGNMSGQRGVREGGRRDVWLRGP